MSFLDVLVARVCFVGALIDPTVFPFRNWPISVSHFRKFR